MGILKAIKDQWVGGCIILGIGIAVGTMEDVSVGSLRFLCILLTFLCYVITIVGQYTDNALRHQKKLKDAYIATLEQRLGMRHEGRDGHPAQE
jgi:hypothetical protein